VEVVIMRQRKRPILNPILVPIIGLLLVVGLQSCTWSGLNDLSKETPVQVYEKPKDFTSAGFGNNLIVLRRTDDSRLPTIIVGGQYTTPIAALEIGPGGGVERTRIARVDLIDTVDNGERKGNAIQSMVELSPVGDDARVLIGVPGDGYVRQVRIPPADADVPDLIVGDMYPVANPPQGIRNFGGAVAAGFFDAPDGEQEWAIADDRNIFIAMNEPDNATDFVKCPYEGPSISGYTSITRALVAGRFTEGDTTDTFVAGLPHSAPPYGEVRFITWSGTVECDAFLLPPPDGGNRTEEYFGTALFAGDLNGDGVDDLVVGSPNKNDLENTNSRVYVYLTTGSPATLTDVPSYTIESDMAHFGSTVAAMDLTGDGVPELVVGDPQASFDSNRGRALIFEVPWAYSATPVKLAEADGTIIGDTAEPTKMFGADLKASTSAFGSSLAGLAWEPGATYTRRELVVGAAEAIFAFYLTGLEGDDDRDDVDQDPRD
jgi:FG-GAP-like repeat